MRYVVDGYEYPDLESNLAGDGEFAPFGVFDVDAQDYVGKVDYPTREAAQIVADALNAAKRICNEDGYHETPEAAALVARYNEED